MDGRLRTYTRVLHPGNGKLSTYSRTKPPPEGCNSSWVREVPGRENHRGSSSGECPTNPPLILLGHLSRERLGHRDQKPIGLIERIMRTSSNVGDFVLDPFSGSGTTLAAAVRLGRAALGFETNPEWVDVITARIVEEVNARKAREASRSEHPV